MFDPKTYRDRLAGKVIVIADVDFTTANDLARDISQQANCPAVLVTRDAKSPLAAEAQTYGNFSEITTIGQFEKDYLAINEPNDHKPSFHVEGTLQLFDLYDNRVDMWKADFELPYELIRHLSTDALIDLTNFPSATGSDDDTTLSRLIEQAWKRDLFCADGWEWGDPYELTIDIDDVEAYIMQRGVL